MDERSLWVAGGRSLAKRSFLHLTGISFDREKHLWKQGIQSWEDFESSEAPLLAELAPGDEARRERWRKDMRFARLAWEEEDLLFFQQRWPKEALWRLVPEFLDRIAYLDIETTGLGMPPRAASTTVTFLFRDQVYQEHEEKKKAELIRWVLAESRLLCTFFGENFDVPFLEAEFGIPFERAHIDLCPWFKRLGYKGGLKKIETLVPELPKRASLDLNGRDAVHLWALHQQGSEGALETLLHYNAEDVVMLEPLLAKCLELQLLREPHWDWRVERIPEPVTLTTRTHPEIYSLLRPI